MMKPSLLIVLLLSVSTPAFSQNREEDRAFRHAVGVLQNDMAASAVDLFRDFLLEYPQSPNAAEAQYLLGAALEEVGDSEAIAAYGEYLRVNPRGPRAADATFHRARSYYLAKQWSDARAAFNSFSVKFPNHVDAALAKYYEGQSLLKLGRPDEAIPLFLQSADSAAMPLRSEAAFSTAAAHFQAGRYTDAAVALSVVGSRFAGTEAAAKAEGLTGDILYRQGQFKEARLRYAKALSANLSYSDELLFFKAWSAVKAGDTAAGVIDLMLLPQKYPRSSRAAEAIRFAVQLSEMAGDTTTALRALELKASLTEDEATLAEVCYDKGRIQYAALDNAGARTQFLEVLRLNKTKQAEAEYYLGKIATEEGDFAAAESWLRAAEQKAANARPEGGRNPFEEDVLFAQLNLMRESANLSGYSALMRRLERSKSPALARLIKAGAELFEGASDGENAIKEYGKLISRFPESAEAIDAHYRLGLLHYQAARYVEAESSFIKFIGLTSAKNSNDPLLDDAWYWIGFSRYQTEKMEGAIQAFKEAAAVPGADKRISAILRAGDAAFGLKNYQEAVDAYDQVIEANPDTEDFFAALYNRAEALRSLGRMDEAHAAFENIHARGGADHEQSLFSAAQVLEEAGRETEAMLAYEKCAPSFVSGGREEEAWYKAGLLRAKLGYQTEALANFERVGVKGGSLAPDALYRIGEIHFEQGDTVAAANAFNMAAEGYPSSLFGRRAILKLVLFESSTETTVRTLEGLIKAAPGDAASAEARLKLGIIARKAGKYDSSIVLLKAALENLADGDQLAEAKINLAEAYLSKKMFNPAKSQVQYIYQSRLYRESRFRGEGGLLLGRILIHLNQRNEALKVLKEVADRYEDLSEKAEDIIKSNNLGG